MFERCRCVCTDVSRKIKEYILGNLVAILNTTGLLREAVCGSQSYGAYQLVMCDGIRQMLAESETVIPGRARKAKLTLDKLNSLTNTFRHQSLANDEHIKRKSVSLPVTPVGPFKPSVSSAPDDEVRLLIWHPFLQKITPLTSEHSEKLFNNDEVS